MANRLEIVKPITSNSSKNKFKFNDSFKETFNAMIGIYSNALNDLNRVINKKSIESDYGVCLCRYKTRYITPNNISEYISNLLKGMSTGLFRNRIDDVETFTVASVKKFMEENDCELFEDSVAIDNKKTYVNPKEYTLNDLALLCENDISEVSVYSKGEMLKRLELVSDDVKKMNEMYFAANIKKIVNALPEIIDSSDCISSYTINSICTTFIEDFILFTCTVNTIAVLQMTGYVKPGVEYNTISKDANSRELITESCMINTTDYMIRNRLPFNCNMRDIVLMDVTPDFKDTHDAMHFILQDMRSPISILMNKFATKQADVPGDLLLISNMFVGMDHYACEEYFSKTGKRKQQAVTPLEATGFKSATGWLDTITFGNNYLDGNYRRDAVGNNATNPITNSLDVLYRVFSGRGCKTNEDVANNLVRVANVMRAIIHDYRDGNPIENYDLTKDILTLLGEIFTRNTLRLYYNNTRVYDCTDSMPDAAAPGFICMESFVMEADGDTSNNSTTTSTNAANVTTAATTANATNTNANKTKTTVTFKNDQGDQVKNKLTTKISVIVQKFIQWVREKMMRFSDNFNKNHEKEVDWIKNNMKLNEEIKDAIKKGTFKPNVSNFPEYKINMKNIQTKGLDKRIDDALDVKKEFNSSDFIIDTITNDANVKNELQKKDRSNEETAKLWANYVLYSRVDEPKLYTGALTADMWEDLYTDLTKAMSLIEGVVKENGKQLNDASEKVKRVVSEAETVLNGTKSDSKKLEDAQKSYDRSVAVNKAVQTIATVYGTTTLNVLNSKFYRTSYNLYREIVAGYKQQSNSDTSANATSNETEKAVENAATESESESENNNTELNEE